MSTSERSDRSSSVCCDDVVDDEEFARQLAAEEEAELGVTLTDVTVSDSIC